MSECKYIIIFVLGLSIITACKQPSSKTVKNVTKKDSTKVLATLAGQSLTDSGKLLLHIDSLPKIKFPFESNWGDSGYPTIDLSIFKSKKLFNLPIKLIPTQAGGGLLDDELVDSTFDLTDASYRAHWYLIAKTPKFIVIEVENGVLATITYNLKLIEAIHSAIADPRSNSHFNAERHSTINKDLTILFHHDYGVEDDKGHYDTSTEADLWFINKTGHFKEK